MRNGRLASRLLALALTALMLAFCFVALPAMVGMGYGGDLLRLGFRYAYIYLACMPFSSLTNFLSAILQAQGNTKTPLFVLIVYYKGESDLSNVGSNKGLYDNHMNIYTELADSMKRISDNVFALIHYFDGR